MVLTRSGKNTFGQLPKRATRRSYRGKLPTNSIFVHRNRMQKEKESNITNHGSRGSHNSRSFFKSASAFAKTAKVPYKDVIRNKVYTNHVKRTMKGAPAANRRKFLVPVQLDKMEKTGKHVDFFSSPSSASSASSSPEAQLPLQIKNPIKQFMKPVEIQTKRWDSDTSSNESN